MKCLERCCAVSPGMCCPIRACKSELTPADLLYLFCTCTRAFCRFSPIEPFEFSKSFENPKIGVDRLPPPPPYKSCYFNQIQAPDLALYLIRVSQLSFSD